MPSGCTCPVDGAYYCARCQALLARASIAGPAFAKAPTMAQDQRSPGRASPEDREAEERFLARVRSLAKANGWLCYHTHRSDRSEAGFPDLVCTNGARILIAELKSATGKLTKEQAWWIELLRHTGTVDVRVWKPKDWPAIQDYFTQAQEARRDD